MRSIVVILILLLPLISAAQNPDGFGGMIDRMVKGTVPYISSDGLQSINDSEVYILDTREKEEYEVGHLPNAVYVGYKDLDDDYLTSIPKGATIVTYCSIGYRSEKVGLKLMSMGHDKVFNLKGGIFDWVNNGNQLEDGASSVHGYNKKWSKWVNPDKIQVVTRPTEQLIAE